MKNHRMNEICHIIVLKHFNCTCTSNRHLLFYVEREVPIRAFYNIIDQ